MLAADEPVDVARGPGVEGIRFRRYRGPRDLPALQAVLEAQARADGEPDEVVSLSALSVLFEHASGWIPERHVLIAERAARIVAWSRIQHQRLDTEDAFRSRGYVLPEERGCGLGRAMLARNEADLRSMAASVDSSKPRWYQGWVTDVMPRAARLFGSSGYEQFHWYFEMERPAELDPPDPPDGLLETPSAADLPEIERVMVEAFRGHWGRPEATDLDIRAEVDRLLADPSTDLRLWRIARQEQGIVAALHATYDGATRTGVIDELGTLATHRRRGLASALLASALEGLRTRGADRIRLGVDAEDRFGALGLYERFGFRVRKRGIGYRKAMPGPRVTA